MINARESQQLADEPRVKRSWTVEWESFHPQGVPNRWQHGSCDSDKPRALSNLMGSIINRAAEGVEPPGFTNEGQREAIRTVHIKSTLLLPSISMPDSNSAVSLTQIYAETLVFRFVWQHEQTTYARTYKERILPSYLYGRRVARDTSTFCSQCPVNVSITEADKTSQHGFKGRHIGASPSIESGVMFFGGRCLWRLVASSPR